MSLNEYLENFGDELDDETRRDIERFALSSEACSAPEAAAPRATRAQEPVVEATPAMGQTTRTTRTRARTALADTASMPPPPPVAGAAS